MTPEEREAGHVGFARAPGGWNWAAQAKRGTWYWFRVKPIPDRREGDWIVPRDHVQYAGEGEPNLNWVNTLRQRAP